MSAPATSASTLDAIRVLVVEDDDGYATALSTELSKCAVPVALTRVRTLADAQAIVRDAPADVVLLDLCLPDSEGIETFERLQAAARDVAVVVLTASDDDTLAIAAVQRGAQDYLIKGAAEPELLARSLRYACERMRFRRALMEREARFRALVEHSHEAITLLDENLAVLYDSRAIEMVTGCSPEERLGRSLATFVHPDDLPEVMKRLREVLDHPGKVVPLEYRYPHKDGSWRHGEAFVVNRLNDPAVQALVANHRDITDRRRAEEALRVSEEQLRQAHKMEAVGRLAGGVAHDFNNVLTAIFGYADLLLDQFAKDDPRRHDVEEIRRSAERAAALTRQLLAFSRKQVMQPRVLDLNDVIASLEKLLSRLVGEDITLQITSSSALWHVRADPGQIEQVLMNLCANGRDAMPEGGTLQIHTENRYVAAEEAQRRPGLRTGAHVVLTVEDTGHGMPEEVCRNIFEPFFTTKEQGKGTGLGLATVYGIVKQTGGGIYVESEPGTGTRFVIYLPRVDEARPGSSTTSA